MLHTNTFCNKMRKRSWSIASLASDTASPAPNWLIPVASANESIGLQVSQAEPSADITSFKPSQNHSHPPRSTGSTGSVVQRSPDSSRKDSTPPMPKMEKQDFVAVTTRKSKACPGCRKQKVIRQRTFFLSCY